MTTRHRFGGLRSALTPRRPRTPLARELSEFRSPAELAELSALLDRHPDEQTEALRELVDWTPAA